jgi:hypothetical protein
MHGKPISAFIYNSCLPQARVVLDKYQEKHQMQWGDSETSGA